MTEEAATSAHTRKGQIITFYSYKGGVGRSMAAANIATVFAQRGHSVLLWDMDLEAPGLHRYMLNPDTKLGTRRYWPQTRQLGSIDLFKKLHEELITLGQTASPALTQEAVGEAIATIIGKLLDDPQYLYRVRLMNPSSPILSAELSFIAAGQLQSDYSQQVLDFDWVALYNIDARIFPLLREELLKRYDYVVIDSRTGISDVGSICTALLPDKLVLAFLTNQQSLQGALQMGRLALARRAQMEPSGPLEIFPLLSRVDFGEDELRQRWVGKARSDFARLLLRTESGTTANLDLYFDSIICPHNSYYAYDEQIAAERERSTSAGTLAAAYSHLADSLDCATLLEAQKQLAKPQLDRLDAELQATQVGEVSNLKLLVAKMLLLVNLGEHQAINAVFEMFQNSYSNYKLDSFSNSRQKKNDRDVLEQLYECAAYIKITCLLVLKEYEELLKVAAPYESRWMNDTGIAGSLPVTFDLQCNRAIALLETKAVAQALQLAVALENWAQHSTDPGIRSFLTATRRFQVQSLKGLGRAAEAEAISAKLAAETPSETFY